MSELESIPGVGEKMADDLTLLGIKKVDDLKGKDPEKLYAELCIRKGRILDRCILYVFRCAVYYANEKTHDPEKLKWWNWTDQES